MMNTDADPNHVTAAEQAIVSQLGNAWNAFLALPVEHLDDQAEFRHAIHRAQDLLLARAGRRQINSGAI